MNGLDAILKSLLLGKKWGKTPGHCPDEETLAEFYEGKLTDDEKEKIRDHLIKCEDCLEKARVLCILNEEKQEAAKIKLPPKIKTKILNLDPAGRPASDRLMDIMVRFTANMVEVITGQETIAGPAMVPEPLRSGQQVVSDTLVTFTKEFSPYSAEIEVEKVRPNRGEISIKLTKKEESKKPTGLRVSLFSDLRELESCVAEGGLVVFRNVRFGKYRLDITEKGKEIGKIFLNMKGEGTHE